MTEASNSGCAPPGMAEPDGLTFRPAWVPILATLIAGTVYSFVPMLGLLPFPLGLLAGMIWLPVTLVQLVRAARRLFWRRAASLLAILVCAGPVAVAAPYAGDYIHLALAYPFYAAKVAEFIRCLLANRVQVGRHGVRRYRF